MPAEEFSSQSPGLFLLLLLPRLHLLPVFQAVFPPGGKRTSLEAQTGKSLQTEGRGESSGGRGRDFAAFWDQNPTGTKTRGKTKAGEKSGEGNLCTESLRT